MKYKIRTAVPADEEKIRGLFLEMLRTIYQKDDVKGYGDGDLDRYWSENQDRIFVAEDGRVIAFLSVEVHHDPVDHIYLDDFSVAAAYRNKGIGSSLIRTKAGRFSCMWKNQIHPLCAFMSDPGILCSGTTETGSC